MPGAGKSTIAEGLRSAGYAVVNMGDAVRAEAGRRGLEPTGENLGRLMLGLRERDGPAAVARLVRPQIDGAPGPVVVDGIRSDDEIGFLRGVGDVRVLSVHASAGTRFGFLSRRGRSDDPRSRESFDERDSRELGVGVSASIALADESISNNGVPAGELVGRARAIIEGWAG